MYENVKPTNVGAKVAFFVIFIAVWLGLSLFLHHFFPPFELGGWGMWPILAVGIIFVVITVDRIRYLFFTARIHRKQFTANVQKHLMGGNINAAISFCNSNPQPLANIVGAGLQSIHQSDNEVQEAMDETALFELPRIEIRTGYLAMIGNIATLLGLLGTIVGLIKSFAGVSLTNVNDPSTIAKAQQYVDLVPACKGIKDGKSIVMCISQNKATILAKGISEAMNCTAFGLLVGILSLLAFSVLNGRTQYLMDEISETSVFLMNLAVNHRKVMKLS